MAKKDKSKGNAATGTSVAPFQPSAVGALKLPAGVTVRRHVTLPSLAIKKDGQTELVTILDGLRISKITQKADASGKTREPATICTIGRHAGEHNPEAKVGQFTMIVPAVVKANLERDYPVDTDGVIPYIGKSFMIRNCGKRSESQRYNDFEILEVDVAATTA